MRQLLNADKKEANTDFAEMQSYAHFKQLGFTSLRKNNAVPHHVCK
jgi:hypothetical protein